MLHKHSTLFGLLTTALVAALAGYVTHWHPAAIGIALFAGVLIFPRAFYGFKAANALDESARTPDSLGDAGRFSPRDMAGLNDESYRLHQAYEQYQAATSGGYDVTGKIADPNALTKLAEEERREQS
ncbi:MAG TPA: hypothetical protein VFL13_06605 [Candidatus Baltobacteraceae bacterium]|nr:hypothetical protein [Candidatus Baltobacteraceae bacterium]